MIDEDGNVRHADDDPTQRLKDANALILRQLRREQHRRKALTLAIEAFLRGGGRHELAAAIDPDDAHHHPPEEEDAG